MGFVPSPPLYSYLHAGFNLNKVSAVFLNNLLENLSCNIVGPRMSIFIIYNIIKRHVGTPDNLLVILSDVSIYLLNCRLWLHHVKSINYWVYKISGMLSLKYSTTVGALGVFFIDLRYFIASSQLLKKVSEPNVVWRLA